ncbi:MAG TPA: HEPN domain-containing protein [Puia sp.]|jgi:HEPN domain-containing protein
MNTSLQHLPSIKREQVRDMIKIVLQAANPEKIILFGIYGTPGAGTEIFADHHFPAAVVTYDLLVVTRRGDHRSDYALQDIIENRCRGRIPVTVLAHDIDFVNSRLTEGHYFFTTMVREATLLYDAGHIPLAKAGLPDLQQIRTIAEKDFERWRQQARAFFRSAAFNRQHKERRVAVFLLHQTAEHIYQAILLAFTGFKFNTHNLDKLRRYTNRFSIELTLLFPRDNEEEDRLFRLLLQGYVDARYKDGYNISEEDLELLSTRIGQLLSIAERICRNRFLSLEKMATGKE